MRDQAFRDLMAAVCAPVTVVTTVDEDGPHGTTVSAFASLSLHPPLVTVALDQHSALLARILATGRLGVNVLGSADDELALRFARGGDRPLRRRGLDAGPGPAPARRRGRLGRLRAAAGRRRRRPPAAHRPGRARGVAPGGAAGLRPPHLRHPLAVRPPAPAADRRRDRRLRPLTLPSRPPSAAVHLQRRTRRTMAAVDTTTAAPRSRGTDHRRAGGARPRPAARCWPRTRPRARPTAGWPRRASRR